MSGYAPLSYTTVEAWARLMGTRVRPWEVEALIAVDAVLLAPGTPVDPPAGG